LTATRLHSTSRLGIEARASTPKKTLAYGKRLLARTYGSEGWGFESLRVRPVHRLVNRLLPAGAGVRLRHFANTSANWTTRRRPRTARALASYPILRATATTLPSRPRAPVTGHTTRHHGMYRWSPSPMPGSVRRATVGVQGRQDLFGRHLACPADRSTRRGLPEPKHLAADPWTPPPSRLRSASIG
jgi:hypothetical protein